VGLSVTKVLAYGGSQTFLWTETRTVRGEPAGTSGQSCPGVTHPLGANQPDMGEAKLAELLSSILAVVLSCSSEVQA